MRLTLVEFGGLWRNCALWSCIVYDGPIIDAHTHLTFDFDPDYEGAQLRGLQRTIPEQAIRSTENARKTLMAGFTTVRDVGSSDFIDVGLRNAINTGVAPGPRMLVAVHALGGTGGHCDDQDSFRHGLFGHESGIEEGVVNTPDEARRAVRFNIKYGADVIKTCASGGVLSLVAPIPPATICFHGAAVVHPPGSFPIPDAPPVTTATGASLLICMPPVRHRTG